MRRGAIVALALLLLVSLLWVWRARPGRVVYRGGPVLTLDADLRVASALATEGDRIVAVGDAAAVEPWLEGARVVELEGRALLPGFIDAHGHFPGQGIYAVVADLNSPPIGEVEDMEDLLAALLLRAAQTEPGEWIVGMSYDDTLLAEKRHPTREDLDRISRENPVGIIHVSGHLAVVNGAGLTALGIADDSADPVGGVIRRDPESGLPDGVLEETAAEWLAEAVLKPKPLDAWRIVRRACAAYLAAGVTTAQTGYADALQLRSLTWLGRVGLLPLRVVIWPNERVAAGLDPAAPVPGARVTRGAVKLVADGSIQGYTGYLSEPYFVPPGDDPGYRGYPRIPRDALLEQVERFHAAGWQVAVHGNGDASIDDILDSFAAAQRAHPREDTRHVIIHAQMARPDQLDRMAELGVIPSFFSLHTYYWGDRHRDVFMGPERAARMSPARSAAERGLRFTIHADAPVVPMEPLRLVWAAVNRRSTSGAAIGPEERIDTLRALQATTLDAARQHFQEDQLGSLEPGKLADLVVLDRNPLDDPASIDEIRVLETIVGGRRVWSAEAP